MQIKNFFLLIVILFIGRLAFADTVIFDTATASNNATTGSPCTWPITIGAGTSAINKVAVLSCAATGNPPASILTATLGGVAFSTAQVTNYPGEFMSVYISTLAAPASGSQTISVTPSNSASCGGTTNAMSCVVMDFAGVKQASIVDVSTGALIPGASGITLSATATNSGDMLVDAYETTSSGLTLTPGSSQVQPVAAISNTSQGNMIAWSYKGPQASAGSQTMSWSTSSTPNQVYAWIALNASPPTGPFNQGLLIRGRKVAFQ